MIYIYYYIDVCSKIKINVDLLLIEKYVIKFEILIFLFVKG